MNLLTAHCALLTDNCALRTSCTAILIVGAVSVPAETRAQDEQRCEAARRFLVEQVGMTAVTRSDTIDDWRTRKIIPGCRVTAAGLTTRALVEEATLFYQRLRGDGWIRTPDPRDAPNESSLRFRLEETDCLFNFYTGGILGTEGEMDVNSVVVPKGRERRYNFLVQCMPAMEAAPR